MTKLNIILIAATILGSGSLSSCNERLIIDTDGGPDDAMAILLAISAFRNNDSIFEIVGITCTYGNTHETTVQKNIFETLRIANASDIPVYSGAKKPLIKPYNASDWFGDDGFGNFKSPERITATVNDTYKAHEKLIKEVSDYPGQLTILALGPLTNIALAILKDSNFIVKVKKIYIMGGRMTYPDSDYNFRLDPESDLIVLKSNGGSKNKILFTWEANRESVISLEWRTGVLANINSTFINFLNEAENVAIRKISYSNNELRVKEKTLWSWGPSDVKTAAAMMWPELILKEEKNCVLPIIEGKAEGMLAKRSGEICLDEEKLEMIMDFDAVEFKAKLLRHLS